MTIFDLLDRLAFLRGAPAAALVLVTAFLALVLWDYRPAVLALGLAYLAGGLLFVDLLDPRLAVVFTLSGVFVTLIMAVTARQINWGRPPDDLTPGERATIEPGRRVQLGPLAVPARTLLRAVALGAALAAAFWLWRAEPSLFAIIPAEQDYIRLAVLSLIALGLAGMATTPEPFPAGLGLLIFLLGFDLYMSVVEQSIEMAVALVALNLLVALVTSYLAQARSIPVDVVE